MYLYFWMHFSIFLVFFLKKQNYFLNYSQIISKILSIHIIHAHFILLACTVCWIFQKGEVNFTTYIDSTKFVRYYLKRHRNFWETNHNIGCLCSFILTFIWDKIFTWRVKHISSFFSCQMGAKTTTFSYTYFLYYYGKISTLNNKYTKYICTTFYANFKN